MGTVEGTADELDEASTVVTLVTALCTPIPNVTGWFELAELGPALARSGKPEAPKFASVVDFIIFREANVVNPTTAPIAIIATTRKSARTRRVSLKLFQLKQEKRFYFKSSFRTRVLKRRTLRRIPRRSLPEGLA